MKNQKIKFALFIIILVFVIAAGLFAYALKYAVHKGQIPEFKDYAVTEKFKGKIAVIDYSGNKYPEMFKTAIGAGVAGGVNFAGHYIVVKWGCGSDCEQGAVVDAINGSVYEIHPSGWSCGIKFQSDSSLFIQNADQADCSYDWAGEKYYNWENNKFVLIYPTK